MKKILAIDDVKNNLILIKSILSKQFPEYEILLANSGEEGLKMAREELPQTILLDIYMPDMDGYTVSQELKKDVSTKNIPILMISAYGSDSKVRVKGLNAGADAFISKPFHMEELIALVNVMLRIKDAEDLLRKQNQNHEITIKKLREAEKVQKSNLNKINKYQNKLKQLNSELVLTEEKEKKAIAGYLHDGIGQTLSIAHIRLTSLLNDDLNEKTKTTLHESTKLIDAAINDSRLLTYDLSPPILYELGLAPAIKWKLEQISNKDNLASEFYCDDDKIGLNTNSLILVYRIVCELLLNVVKHANATKVEVEITKNGRNYSVTVFDNGCGFDYKKVSNLNKQGGYGLFSINERLESINGNFIIKSDKQTGTKAKITFPIMTT